MFIRTIKQDFTHLIRVTVISHTNWTHSGTSGRIIVPVGVGYDSDPDQVREILLDCASKHQMILGKPEPVVYFMDFGASSLDFQLRCHLADINWGVVVKSDLRYEILRRLREAKIEIPFPQRDVNLKHVTEAPKPAARKSRATKPKKQTRVRKDGESSADAGQDE